jgi:hypothetical protein
MTAASHEKVRRSSKGRSKLPRGPTLLRAETAVHSRDLPGKGVAKTGSIGLTPLQLTRSEGAGVTAATVRGWPVDVAVAIVPDFSPCLGGGWLCHLALRKQAVKRRDRSTAPVDLYVQGPVVWPPVDTGRPSRRPHRTRRVRAVTVWLAEPVPSTAEIRAWLREQFGCRTFGDNVCFYDQSDATLESFHNRSRYSSCKKGSTGWEAVARRASR